MTKHKCNPTIQQYSYVMYCGREYVIKLNFHLLKLFDPSVLQQSRLTITLCQVKIQLLAHNNTLVSN